MSRLVFLGTPELAVPPLLALHDAGHEIALVVTRADRRRGRGSALVPSPVKAAAAALGLPVTDRIDDVVAVGAELGVVVAFGRLIPGRVLDQVPMVNLHFSLLPRWRGAAPVNLAILEGDEVTGVSLMRLTPGLDEGPVLAASSRPITLQDTAESLLPELARDAAELLRGQLNALAAGAGRPEPQDDARATLAPKLTKAMAVLDPGRPAAQLHRQVRALQPWPGAELTVNGTLVKVCAVGGLRPDQGPAGSLVWNRQGAWLTAGDGMALELTLLQRPGKPVQPAPQALQPWGAVGAVQTSWPGSART